MLPINLRRLNDGRLTAALELEPGGSAVFSCPKSMFRTGELVLMFSRLPQNPSLRIASFPGNMKRNRCSFLAFFFTDSSVILHRSKAGGRIDPSSLFTASNSPDSNCLSFAVLIAFSCINFASSSIFSFFFFGKSIFTASEDSDFVFFGFPTVLPILLPFSFAPILFTAFFTVFLTVFFTVFFTISVFFLGLAESQSDSEPEDREEDFSDNRSSPSSESLPVLSFANSLVLLADLKAEALELLFRVVERGTDVSVS
mmetsp:Transcript_11220/g.13588  ORF Transcript_11220/g.13588 Transcript_11220/m.13588 type:complete len:256 (+) Transcript_11220:545-1312(+)